MSFISLGAASMLKVGKTQINAKLRRQVNRLSHRPDFMWKGTTVVTCAENIASKRLFQLTCPFRPGRPLQKSAVTGVLSRNSLKGNKNRLQKLRLVKPSCSVNGWRRTLRKMMADVGTGLWPRLVAEGQRWREPLGALKDLGIHRI